MFANFGDSDVDTPISSSHTWPVSHCWRVTLRRPFMRRLWRTPICGAPSIRNAFAKPGAEDR